MHENPELVPAKGQRGSLTMSAFATVQCDHCHNMEQFEGTAVDIENHFLRKLEADGWYLGFVLIWCPACKEITPDKDRVILDRNAIQRRTH